MIVFVLQISYNGIDWEKVPDTMHAIDTNGVRIPDMLFIDDNHGVYFIRVVIDQTSIDKEVQS